MEIKFKVLSVDQQARSCSINVYTDVLYQYHVDVVWPERAALEKAAFPHLTDKEAMAIVQQRWPAGGVWCVTIYVDPIPTGQALIDYLLANSVGSGDWLEKITEGASQPHDMSAVQALKDAGVLTAQIITTKEQVTGPSTGLQVTRL